MVSLFMATVIQGESSFLVTGGFDMKLDEGSSAMLKQNTVFAYEDLRWKDLTYDYGLKHRRAGHVAIPIEKDELAKCSEG